MNIKGIKRRRGAHELYAFACREELESLVNRMDALDENTEAMEYLRLGCGVREKDQIWRGRLLQMRHSGDFQTQELLGP